MASSTSTRTPCATCGNKSVGIFKCEGCAQIFCRKHVNEHRDMLSHQLDEIVLQYDTLQQTINEQNDQKNFHHSLMQQIDEWEKYSMKKIQQTVEEARKQVEQLTCSQKGVVSKELDDLAQRLQKARMDDDYIETDLQRWTKILDKLENDINAASPSITVYEDSTKLIGRLNVTKSTQYMIQEERFGELFGDVHIERNGCLIIHSDSKIGNAFVRGTCQYLSGKHKIHFIVNRKNKNCYLSFGIISKSNSMPISENDMRASAYGWKSNDHLIHQASENAISENIQDMHNMTKFEIELLLDCDNQKISYFNQETKRTRELNVDITICPLPWQLMCYLYDIGHSVQLISSKHNL